MRTIVMLGLGAFTWAAWNAAPRAQGQAPAAWPPPQFSDAARPQKLAAAFPEIDKLFADYGRSLPGYAYGVIVDGELRHTGTGGMRDLAAQAPVDADSVFRIASMTKSFTALAILKLRDEGRLSLEDPVERHVKELATLRYPTSDSPRITIRHLMSHAEGFPEDNPWGDRQLARDDAWLSRMMRAGIPFSNPPGLAYEYSNYGFGILGQVVARVSGRPYKDYIAASILTPLGMTATTLEATAVRDDRFAHGYRREDGKWVEEPPLPDGVFGAMGGMLTSLRDLHRYVAFLMSAWPPRSDPDPGAVSRASLREMQQISRSSPSTVTRNAAGDVVLRSGGYGFGLRVSQSCAVRHIVAHSGGLPGYGSLMQWYPEHGVGFIAMGNMTYTGWGGVVEQATSALIRTGAFQPRRPQPSPALVDAREKIARLVTQWDDAIADEVGADNLYLDQPKDRRRRALEDLRAKVGACTVDPDGFTVENALRGQWTMTCERGRAQVAITLAPTMPPKVQYWNVSTNIPSPAATCR
jgi:CubicO group peptidase (beta-lactamase class C family)